jgi:hypothetical protein
VKKKREREGELETQDTTSGVVPSQASLFCVHDEVTRYITSEIAYTSVSKIRKKNEGSGQSGQSVIRPKTDPGGTNM